MTRRRQRSAKTLAGQVGELAVAVPQVVAHRVMRMAMANPVLSARDKKEFTAMVLEKQVAFAQSWFAVFSHTLRAHQDMTMSLVRLCWPPLHLKANLPRNLARQFGNASLGIAAQGIAPIHRKAVANARRLAKTRLR